MTEGLVIYENAMFWTDGSGILYCRFNNSSSNSKLKYNEAKLFIDAIVKLCNGKAMPFLIDVRNAKGTFSISAAKLIAKSIDLNKLRISEAFVNNNIAISLLIMTYKRLFNPITPYGIFNEIDKAKEYSLETKNNFYGSN